MTPLYGPEVLDLLQREREQRVAAEAAAQYWEKRFAEDETEAIVYHRQLRTDAESKLAKVMEVAAKLDADADELLANGFTTDHYAVSVRKSCAAWMRVAYTDQHAQCALATDSAREEK